MSDPKYAASANPARRIKAMCTTCGCLRLAEIIGKDFPGRDVLKKAKHGEYRARCLKCGYDMISDQYNWWLA